MSAMLFDGYPDPEQPAPAEREAKLSTGQRRTLRQKADVERGIHPLRRHLPIVDNGHHCGDCDHLMHRHMGGSYLKCDLTPMTHGPGSDLRAWWPACPDWTERA